MINREQINESDAQLAELEGQLQADPRIDRVRMLRLLAGNPSLTVGLAAKHIGVSERTAQRWWRLYRQEGIAALTGRQREGRITERELDEIRNAIRENRFRSTKEIKAWIAHHLGISLSIQSVSTLLKERVKAGHVWTVEEKPMGTRSPVRSSSKHDNWVEFFNTLSPAGNVVDWAKALQKALLRLVLDIDHISVIVNVDCDLGSPGKYDRSNVVRQHVPGTARDKSRTRIAMYRKEEAGGDRRIDELRAQGYPLDDYHTPIILDYHLEQKAFVGSILLFREVQKASISEGSLDFLRSIEPGLVFLLTDAIARQQKMTPVGKTFNNVLTRLGEEAGLTQWERDVLGLHLFGQSYEQIGKILFVSIETVRKHVKSIHRKTGVKTATQLFAKYFTALHPEEKVP